MNKRISLLPIFFGALMLSCSNDNEPETPICPTQAITNNLIIGVDETPGSSAEFQIYDLIQDEVATLNISSTGVFEDITYLCENGDIGAIKFNENGLIETIIEGDMVLSFANYEGNTVDVAFTRGEEVGILQDIEVDTNWDTYIQECEAYRLNKRSFVMDLDKSLSQLSRNANIISDMCKDGVETVLSKIDKALQQYGLALPNIKTEGVIKEVLTSVDIYLAEHGYETDFAQYSEVVDGTIQGAEDAYDTVMDVVKKGALGTYKVLLNLGLNYDDYKKFIEEQVYKFAIILDEHSEDISLGQGSLKSGYGTLKVTLTWGFYADVDLHATEPNGTHIYYADKVSSETGGWLDVDNRKGGNGAIENIYWESPEEGTYTIKVNYYGSSTYNYERETGYCKVTVFCDGYGKTFNFYLNDAETVQIAKITMPDGTINGEAFVDARTLGQLKITVPYKAKD